MRALWAATLTSHLVRDPAPVSPSVWRKLRTALSTESLSGIDDLRRIVESSLVGAEASNALERLELVDQVSDALERLASEGIGAVCDLEPEYPMAWLEKIPRSAPPLLFVAGETPLLQYPSIGVVGARDADPPAQEFAVALAREIARLGFAVVSGGARGIDRAAMGGALAAGGSALGIMADSLGRAHAQAQQEGAYEGALCQCSPYAPDAPFSVGNAMGRNKLIYAHSRASVVVCATEGSGGTWSGAVEALKQDLCPVLVWDEALLPGNQKLIRMGGVALEAAESLEFALGSASPLQGTLF